MQVVKHIILFFVALTGSFFSVELIGSITLNLFHTGGLGDYALGIVSLILAFIFWVPFIYEFLGDRKVYIWFLVVVYLPIFLYILTISIAEKPYIWPITALLGFGTGYLLRKLKEYILTQIKKPTQKITP